MFSSPTPHCRAISPEAYTLDLPNTGRVGLHRSYSRPFSPGDCTQHPHGPPPTFRMAGDGKVGDLQRFIQGRCLAHHTGRSAFSRSLSTWPRRHDVFSGPPGDAALAAYPSWKGCRVRAESSEQARTRSGRLWFHAGPPFIPHRLFTEFPSVRDLVLSTAAHASLRDSFSWDGSGHPAMNRWASIGRPSGQRRSGFSHEKTGCP